jgi:hypothetical protein
MYLQPYEGAGLGNPIRRDGKIICLDTETGQQVWSLTGWVGYNPGVSMPVISDGRILYLDVHTNQIICIGKGPSQTTVSAPQTVPALGSSITITGTVTDQSPSGSHNVNGGLELALKGTPAISDASMDGWMEHLFQNRPIPANTTGVIVSVDTVDPNGNYFHVGNTTTDINGNFGIPYTPDVPGTYQIIVKFEGSNAYGPSSATTYLTIGSEPTTQPTQTVQQLTLPPTEIYFAISTIAIVIAIAIVGAILFTAIKKRA